MNELNMIKKGLGKMMEAIHSDTEEKLLILITRKGYWLYRSMKNDPDYSDIFRDMEEDSVYTDRYMSKNIDPKFVEDKNVYIFDDSVVNGVSLLHTFFELYRLKAKDVKCYTIALSAEYPNQFTKKIEKEYENAFRETDERNRELFRKFHDFECFHNAFRQSIHWEIRYSPENMSRFFIAEMRYFEERLAPLVMDLPLLQDAKNDLGLEDSIKTDLNNAKIRMRQSEFDKLRVENYEWEYISNEYKIRDFSKEGEMFRIGCDFFQYNGKLCWERLEELFLDFVVKVKYRVIEGNEEDPELELVFTPFALINSWNLETVEVCFHNLFGETEYGKAVLSVLSNNNEQEQAYNNMYRGIIYYMSCYVGLKFCEYVERTIHKKIQLFSDALSENSEKVFYKDINHIFQNFSEIQFANQLLKLNGHQAVKGEVIQTDHIIDGNTNEDVYLRLYQWILESKWENKIVYIEDIIASLENERIFNDPIKCKQVVTAVVITMLEATVIGNKIKIDLENHIAHRGIRYGEMLDMLLLQGSEYIYVYMYAFYLKMRSLNGLKRDDKEGNYCENYEKFISLLKRYFEQEKQIGRIISPSAFDFLLYYYRKLKDRPKDLEAQIFRKRYLLSRYDSQKATALFVNKVFRWMESIV